MYTLIKCQDRNPIKHYHKVLQTENPSKVKVGLENVFLIAVFAQVSHTLMPALPSEILVMNRVPNCGAGPHTDHEWTHAEVLQKLKARFQRVCFKLFLALVDYSLV